MKMKRKDPDLLAEYDFSGGVRGKYARRYAGGTNVVVLDPDVARLFPDHDSVNDALRRLAAEAKRRRKGGRTAAASRRRSPKLATKIAED